MLKTYVTINFKVSHVVF